MQAPLHESCVLFGDLIGETGEAMFQCRIVLFVINAAVLQ
jgi:hypothetical protein